MDFPPGYHRTFTGIFDDGSQLLIVEWLNPDGTVREMTAATRPVADRAVVWGPPVTLLPDES